MNVTETENVLKCCIKNNIKKLIFASSAAVYTGVIPKFISNISKEESIEIYGDVKQKRNFVSIFNVVTVFDCAIKNIEGRKANVYNTGIGYSISVNELTKKIQEFAIKKIEMKYKKQNKNEIKYTVADVTLAKKKLGFITKHKLQDELIK